MRDYSGRSGLGGTLAAKFKARIDAMATVTFDTHEFFNELKSSGFSEQ